WDSGAAGASTYDNDIAGIGQDVASGLLQAKSRSVNSDSLVTVSGASDQNDLEFFTWGNDDGSVANLSTNVPAGLPGIATGRITREWLAQNNGGDGIGTVTVSFDLADQSALINSGSAGDYALLIDDDGNFSNATVHTTGANLSSNVISFTGADIRSAGDGLYFSLAGPGVNTPGGVASNLQMWLKADEGVYTNTGCSTAAADTNNIGCWEDQSLQGNNITEVTSGEQPDYVSVATDEDFNFNPSLRFDDSDQLTRASMLASGDNISVFAVYRKDTLSGNDQIIGFGADADDPGLETSGSSLQVRNDASTPATLSHGTSLSTGITYLSSLRATNGANNGVDLRLNGDEDTDATFDMVTIGTEVAVGSDYSTVATDPFDGEIAELVVYNADLSDLNTRQIESYLAIKYGITIDQTAGTSYLASNCTT
ncbi:MAG: hypothetical protein K8I00_04295, partial [Candidatus Omnitrophica bacterium]|nr:hypothetical protein [Candidatus Omnitrophota bacterium]